MSAAQFHEVGKETGKIDVRVSYRIIKLFSDGLYSSPNKAVEELVSNAWDAGAAHAHVILPPDRDGADAKIVGKYSANPLSLGVQALACG